MLPYSHLLIVVDKPELASRLTEGLRGFGYGVTWEGTAEAGLNFARHHEAHLFILAKRLPEMSGQQLAVRLRQHGKTQPILMLDDGHGTTEPLVAASSTIGQITILNERTPLETLVITVRNQLQRAYGRPAADDLIVAGDLVIDLSQEKVWRGNSPIPLTPSEFHLLSYLARHPGETLGREQIRRALQAHGQPAETNDDSAIKDEVGRLRQKIASGHNAPQIVTVPDLGYRLINRSYH